MKWKIFKRIHKKEVLEENKVQFYRFFEFDSFPYVLDLETKELFKIREKDFKKMTDSTLCSKVLDEGTEITDKEALEFSSFNYIPAHMEEWLVVKNNEERRLIPGIDFYMPTFAYPELKLALEKSDQIKEYIIYTVEEDLYETSFGDGLYYHFDRAFLSEETMNKYLILRNCSQDMKYHPRKLKIKIEGNKFITGNSIGSKIDEYKPEEIFQDIEDILSDPFYERKMTELLKVYYIFQKHDLFIQNIDKIQHEFMFIRSEIEKMDLPSHLKDEILTVCHSIHSRNISDIGENMSYSIGTFANCKSFEDCKELELEKRLQNVIGVCEYNFSEISEFIVEDPIFNSDVKLNMLLHCIGADILVIINQMKMLLDDIKGMLVGAFEEL